MGRILNIQVSSNGALFYRWETPVQMRIDDPIPNAAENQPDSGSGKDLGNSVVSQVDPRIHGEEGEGPGQEGDNELLQAGGKADAWPEGEDGEVGRKEKDEPAMVHSEKNKIYSTQNLQFYHSTNLRAHLATPFWVKNKIPFHPSRKKCQFDNHI